MSKSSKKLLLIIAVCGFALSACSDSKKTLKEEGLKDVLKDKFLIGTALNTAHIFGADTLGVEIVKKQFDAIVPENCMKSRYLQPEEGKFFFDEADKFVAFGEANNLWITGHCLVWHEQTPEWFFIDENGDEVSRETLIERMKNHITTVVSRYKGRIKGWDVVNEAILDDGSWRQSKFYRIIGEDFIPLAFRFAHEADPEAELYYNDYSTAIESKCRGIIDLVKAVQEKGLRIDAVGMQGHFTMDFPTVEAFERSLLAFSDLGVKVMITEMDLTVLPSPDNFSGAEVSANFDFDKALNPYAEGLPEDIALKFQNRYTDFFKLFLKHSDKISRVTLWGVSDGDSWRNNWPIFGRTDYALLFDRNRQAKPAVSEIINLTKQNK
ncbi:MAG: endo-1,4-beta-xylanase [Prevotellaceae bacterium]|jgi:endo-1,4-beta-xylanase|nr:endo-1,4-beta-xylanase [Prevotellaceae bacterium]